MSVLLPCRQKRGDLPLYLYATALAILGVIMVYSASSYTGALRYGDAFFFMKKQLVGVGLGLAAMLGVRLISYHKIARLWWLWLVLSFALLILVLIPGVGVENYGAKRWIQLPGFTLQASELCKYGYIIFAAVYMSKRKDQMHRFRSLLPMLAIGFGFCVLIMLEPNMSITICMVGLMFSLMFIGGARLKHFLLMMIPIAVAIPLLILAEPYRLARLFAFIDPWASPKGEGFQLLQSFYSLGSGGWFGVGLFQSRQKYLFLPFSESDFIFSIIGEELGLFGSICVMVVYALLVFRCIKIAQNAADRLGCYLASGVAAIIAIQVLVNLAVVTGSIPPTGLPMPLISSGSSSIIVTLAAIGLVQSVACHQVETRGVLSRRPKMCKTEKTGVS